MKSRNGSLKRRKPLNEAIITNVAAFNPMCFDSRYALPQRVKLGRWRLFGYQNDRYAIAVGKEGTLPDKFDLYVLLCLMQAAFPNEGVAEFGSWREMASFMGTSAGGRDIERLEVSIERWWGVFLKIENRVAHIFQEIDAEDGLRFTFTHEWINLHGGYWTRVSPTVIRKLRGALQTNLYLHLKASAELSGEQPFRRNVRTLYQKLSGRGNRKVPRSWRPGRFLDSLPGVIGDIAWTYSKKRGDVYTFTVVRHEEEGA